ncbi:uncharacterized protein [Hetaerina americana]|uniref:uncharacterized protein isoform X2 n=1 Tax=Hetaerina americana TaxID=62018 RepID=UPI003A7F5BDA
MDRNQPSTRIPVFRSGIPLALGGSRVRQTTQLPVRAGARPTALAGLNTHWPESPERRPSPVSSSTNSSPSSPSSTTTSNRIPDSGPSLPSELSVAHLGSEVIVGGTKRGVLRFLGPIPFDSGLFCGVELHKPEGLNDGSVRGIRLFHCKPQHGVLAPLRKVSPLPCPKKTGVSPVLDLPQPATVLCSTPSSGEPSPLAAKQPIPSGVKRQRTNAYESEAVAVLAHVLPSPDVLEEDDVSTPREEGVGGEGGSTDERWSSEEVTPPAEQAVCASSFLCPSVVVAEKTEKPDSENERGIKHACLSSVPSPMVHRTLEWTSLKSSNSGENLIVSSPPRQSRSISDSSIVEMAGVISSSSPETAAGDGALTSRCGRRAPSGNASGALRQRQSQHQSNQQQHCNSSDSVFGPQQRNCGEECFGGQHGAETCTCGREISKHSSFEMDESLGILTPDQMIDFTVCIEGYCMTPSMDEAKQRFAEGGGVVASTADHFVRPSEGPHKGFGPEESARFSGELGPLSAVDGPESPSLPPPPEDLAEDGVAEKGEAMVEAPAVIDGPSDMDEEAQMDDEEEVKDVMADAPSSALAPSSKSAQVAPCFVASVTSITSIDPGYQGDGEWSRPASRADNSPGSSAPPGIGVNFGIPVDVLKLKIDTMTDSDFYSDTGAGGTESDADHEEAVREGAMAPGDRRAQVIDGTLYGGMGGQHGGGPGGGLGGSSHQQPPPRCFAAVMTSSTATTTEEMESSGVFSDLDRRQDVRVSFHSQALPRPSSAQGVSSSAAESSDVPQSPLEELPEDPKKDTPFTLEPDKVAEDSEDGTDMRVEMEVTLVEGEKMDTSSPPAEVAEEFSVLNQQEPNLSMPYDASPDRTQTATAGPTSPSPRANVSGEGGDQQQAQEMQESLQQQHAQEQQQVTQGHGTKQKATGNSVNVSPPKKHKMPKRNVASKIKAMIEAPLAAKEEGGGRGEEGEARRPQSQRPGRWDAIMSKIAAGQAEQRSSRPRLREVKSRVMASLGTTSTNASRHSTTNEEGASGRAKKTFISNATRARRGETRRARARALDMSSLRDAACSTNTAAPSGEVGDSLNPSVHSSMSDVSLSRGAVAKASTPSRSSKKREADRSASPFSDGSSNSGASNIPRPIRKNLGAIPKQPSPEKGTGTEMKAPSSRKPGTRHLSSGAQAQKPAPLRESNTRLGGSVVVSKNGGPATAGHGGGGGNGARGNTVVLLQRQHVQMAATPVEAAAPLPPPSASVEVSAASDPKPTAAPEGSPPVPPKLLEELRQSTTRIEALLVVIHYLVGDLDAFSTPSLKKAVEEYKTEAINAKLNLDEANASCQRLTEEKEISEVRCKETIDELIRKHEENLAELEARLTSQIEETQCRYEEELKRRDRLNNRNMEALLEDLKLYAERAEKAEKKVERVERQVEDLQKEKEEIMARESDLKQLITQLQNEMTDLEEKLRKETVIKAGDCGKHRDEIQSLQAVLDLRTKELHDHRKKTEEYRQKSEALNSALARNAALQARVEDLEAQLQRKVATERKLQERVRHLSENVERECRQNEQLVLENEVLEWKINESSKLMASYSGQSDMSSSMTGSMMASSSPSSDRRSISTMAISLGSPDSPPNFVFPRFSPRLSPKSPFSDMIGTIELEEEEEEEEEDMEDDEEEEEEEETKVGGGEEDEDDEDDSKLSIEPTPITPKVRTLVEKNESISWLVEMEEVIPASSLSSQMQAGAIRRPPHSASPLNLLPQMIPELTSLTNSPSSTSPTSSDPSSSMFRKGILPSPPSGAAPRRTSAAPPVAKKTRPERGKLAGHGMVYTSTPFTGHRHLVTSSGAPHHHRRYHHQPRSVTRSSDSPICSARSRSVSTDSESLDAEEASAAAGARLDELKAWRGTRVPVPPEVPTEEGVPQQGKVADGGQAGEEEEGRDGDGDCSRLSGEDPPSPRSKPPTPSNNGSRSPFCEFGDDFSDQSPFHGQFEVNGTSLNPMEDSSSSVEILLEMPKKTPGAPPPTSQGPSTGGPGEGTAGTAEMHHQMHHYQPRHVLSSLCAHPHLSIKESAGEAMISEEISDDTQGESEEEEEERGNGKLLEDSEDSVEVVGILSATPYRIDAGGIPSSAATPSAEAVVGSEVIRVEEPRCNGNNEMASRDEPTPGTNSLKLGQQQLLSSSTPDSSHLAHTDSSVMELSWSEELELMPSESEV